jgi:SAM-dependent methyltransferase
MPVIRLSVAPLPGGSPAPGGAKRATDTRRRYDRRVTSREFLIRATASAGYRFTRLSARLERRPPSKTDHRTDAPMADRTLVGERDVEWAWTLAHVHRGPGRVLDFGSGNGLLALGASFAGNDTVAIDLEHEQYLFGGHSIEYVQGDFAEIDFEPGSFDQIINCSSIEHVGLAGRYGSADHPDGDLDAMAKLAGLLKPDGDMVLSIPLGVDGVYPPWHRVYGEGRLPLLLEHWTVREESYWAKTLSERYEPVSLEQALADQGSAAYYALGLYVVGPR